MGDEDRRAERLLAAQDKAAALFAAVEDRGLVAAGQGERVVSDRIAFADFGPIFEEFEADFGRTFVLGGDRVKHRLRDDLPVLFAAGREAFAADPGITGKQLYEVVAGRAADVGWVPGG